MHDGNLKLLVLLLKLNNGQIHLFPKICQRHLHALSEQMAISCFKRRKHDRKIEVT
jgi:hypothetical protein